VVVGYSNCSSGASASLSVEDISKDCISYTSEGCTSYTSKGYISYTSEGYRKIKD
jgi:hypothetical protein